MIARRMMQAMVAALSIALAALATPANAAELPEDVVRAFYTAYFQGGKSGLPTVDEMARLSPYLSPGLVRLIEAARAEQQAFMAQNPGEKPPWIEGDLFSSLFEGPTGFMVGAVAGGKDGAQVSIRFTYTDPADSEATVAWEDAVILREEGGRWLIDDVLFLAGWEFKPGASLTGVLEAGAE